MTGHDLRKEDVYRELCRLSGFESFITVVFFVDPMVQWIDDPSFHSFFAQNMSLAHFLLAKDHPFLPENVKLNVEISQISEESEDFQGILTFLIIHHESKARARKGITSTLSCAVLFIKRWYLQNKLPDLLFKNRTNMKNIFDNFSKPLLTKSFEVKIFQLALYWYSSSLGEIFCPTRFGDFCN